MQAASTPMRHVGEDIRSDEPDRTGGDDDDADRDHQRPGRNAGYEVGAHRCREDATNDEAHGRSYLRPADGQDEGDRYDQRHHELGEVRRTDDLLRIVTPADERTGHDRHPAAASGGGQDTSAEPEPGDDPIPQERKSDAQGKSVAERVDLRGRRY